jgi:hypothetical protein
MSVLILQDPCPVRISDLCCELKLLLIQDLWRCAVVTVQRLRLTSPEEDVAEITRLFSLDMLDKYVDVQDVHELCISMSKHHLDNPVVRFWNQFQTVCDVFNRMGVVDCETRIMLLCRQLQRIRPSAYGQDSIGANSAVKYIEALSLADVGTCDNRLQRLSLDSFLPWKQQDQSLCSMLGNLAVKQAY